MDIPARVPSSAAAERARARVRSADDLHDRVESQQIARAAEGIREAHRKDVQR